jgi:hypothetical protein
MCEIFYKREEQENSVITSLKEMPLNFLKYQYTCKNKLQLRIYIKKTIVILINYVVFL